jgi:SOS-response transcriptional repressor LexA
MQSLNSSIPSQQDLSSILSQVKGLEDEKAKLIQLLETERLRLKEANAKTEKMSEAKRNEMRQALDLKSKSGIHRLITALEERGFLRRLPNRARALEVIRQPENSAPTPRAAADNVVSLASAEPRSAAPEAALKAANDVIELPLHGRIAAGAPIEALEGQATLPVPAALLGPGEHYALEVSGDSMVEAGIFDGDFALVRRTTRSGACACPS